MRPRFIRFFPVLLALLIFGATEVYAQTGTVVTRSGQRLRGQIVSIGATGSYGGFGNYDDYSSDSIVVRVNGRDRQIPVQDVAFVGFAGNGPGSRNAGNRGGGWYAG